MTLHPGVMTERAEVAERSLYLVRPTTCEGKVGEGRGEASIGTKELKANINITDSAQQGFPT